MSDTAQPDPQPEQPANPQRRRLAKRRSGPRWKLKIGGHVIHIATGEYEDGAPGEVFVDMNGEGTALRVMCNAFAIAVSLGLQYGVSLATFVHAFRELAGEPDGDVLWHDTVKRARSVPHLVMQVLEAEYRQKDGAR